jgi:hypothetical protein
MRHHDRVRAAIEAIDAVNGDASVSRRQTLDSLELLQDHLDPMIEALEDDLDTDAVVILGDDGDEELQPDA